METNFKDISRDIWNDIREGTGYEQPLPDKGDYTNDFYGVNEGETIDMKSLSDFISKAKSDHTLVFDWSKFTTGITEKMTVKVKTGDGMQDRLVTVRKNVPYTYTNDDKKIIKADFTGKLNRRLDYIDNTPVYAFEMKPAQRTINGTLMVLYENARSAFTGPVNTSYSTISQVDTRYIAIMLGTNNLVDLSYFVKTVYGKAAYENCVNLICGHYCNAIKNCKDPDQLDFLYESAPGFVLENLHNYMDYDLIFSHVELLTKADSDQPFSDASGSVIACLSAIGNATLLYNKFSENPKLVKTIFYNLDGVSEFNGQKFPNKFIYASLLNTLALLNAKDRKVKGSFTVGGSRVIDAHAVDEDDIEEKDGTIFLRQGNDAGFGPVSALINALTEEDGRYYDIFDFVEIIETGEDGNEVSTVVTAIYAKTLAHFAEVEDIASGIRIGFDVLAVVIGVVSFGMGAPVSAVLAEIGIGLADMVVAVKEDELMKTPEGRAFLSTYNAVIMAGAVYTLPETLGSLFNAGSKLFSLARTAGKTLIMKFIKLSLLKLIQELEIANFTSGSVRLFETNTEIITGTAGVLNEFRVDQFLENGVFTVIGDVSNATGKTTEEIALIYSGEVIVRSPKSEFGKASYDLLKSLPNKDKFVENVEKIINRRRIVSLIDEKLVGMPPGKGTKMFLDLMDELGNKIGSLTRSPNGNTLVYKLMISGREININSSIEILKDSSKLNGLPVEKGESTLFVDFNIPSEMTQKFSGLGQLMYEDGLGYFLRNKKFENVDATLGFWKKSQAYADYGGQSINLEQFWNAFDKGKSIEEAAFSTFTGKLVKKNGFNKVRYNPENITRDEIKIIFSKK